MSERPVRLERQPRSQCLSRQRLARDIPALHAREPSWLNLVERVFAEITDKHIRRGNFHGVPELEDAVLDCIRARNNNPRPFSLVAYASAVLTKIRRASPAISEARP